MELQGVGGLGGGGISYCGVWVQIFVWNFKGHFQISHKIMKPYTAKYAIWRVMIS